jgi:hypothetical protein
LPRLPPLPPVYRSLPFNSYNSSRARPPAKINAHCARYKKRRRLAKPRKIS